MAYDQYGYQMPSYQPNYQQRVNQIQQWGQPQQQMQQQAQPQMQPPQVRGWPVQSEEEASRAQIDIDGSVFWFPLANGQEVYSKQINTKTFDPVFRVYKLADTPVAPAFDPASFAMRDEVEQLRATVDGLQATIEKLTAKEGKK